MINLITGFWNARYDRSEIEYLSNFKNVLSIPHNMTIFIPKKYEDMVIEQRKNLLEKTDIKIIELEEIKDNYFSKYWNDVEKIRTNPDWINSTEWLKRVPQGFSEWYNPIVMSKVFFINYAYKTNAFNSDVYMWIDAGITKHVPVEFVCYESIQNMANRIQNVLFTAFEYKNQTEIHGFDYSGFFKYTETIPEWVCRATIFGSHKNYIDKFVNDYEYHLHDTLSRGYLGTEESIFTLLSVVNPELYNIYNMGEDIMPIKFLHDMKYNSVI
jgi:hypothetical protein